MLPRINKRHAWYLLLSISLRELANGTEICTERCVYLPVRHGDEVVGKQQQHFKK